MGTHDTALICRNGHVINSSYHDYPEYNTNFCKKCGSETFHSCSQCNAEIQGYVRGSMDCSEPIAPLYCHNCGKPYPWTDEKLKAIREIIEFSNISDDDKEDFNNNLPDIIADTPRTKLASLKIKTICSKLGKELISVTRDILVDIASETAKKSMGL